MYKRQVLDTEAKNPAIPSEDIATRLTSAPRRFAPNPVIYPRKEPIINIGRNIPPAAPEPKQRGVIINFTQNIVQTRTIGSSPLKSISTLPLPEDKIDVYKRQITFSAQLTQP